MALGLRFLAGSPNVELQGARPLPGTANYLIGNDPSKWRTGLPTYGEVMYRDLWPGIDVAFRGADGQLKYEFLLQPGASVEDVRLAYPGTEQLSLGRDGSLRLQTALGVLTDAAPVSYQLIQGERVAVESRYLLGPGGTYGFAVDRHERRFPLVIDPGLSYSTYLGGSGAAPSGLDFGQGIAVDSTGSAYVTGRTVSSDFPTTLGAFDTSYNGGANDAFVTKLDPTGSTLLFSTYLGGAGEDRGNGIALDASGGAYVTGATRSGNFPTTPGAFDTSLNGGSDVFVAKVNPTGSNLLFSTYLGGGVDDQGSGIAVDASGSAYVTGRTTALGPPPLFPTTPGSFDTTPNGLFDAFVTKLNPAGSTLVFSTYLGGSRNDEGFGVAVDGSGNAHVTGSTTFFTSGNFPTTPGAFDTTPGATGDIDAFVTKLSPTGSILVFSTYLGGSSFDVGLDTALDGSGSSYVTGRTSSTDFPSTPGAFDTTSNGGGDAFVTKLALTGSTLVFSSYLGGGTVDEGFGIALDGSGSAFVTGFATSGDFPTTPGAFDNSHNGGNNDAFVTKMDPTGGSLAYSTFLGGAFDDQGFAIDVDVSGSAYVTGFTTSVDFPTTPGAFQPANAGHNDAFVTKLDMGAAPPATLTLSPPTDSNPVGTSHTVTATVEDASGNPVPSVTVQFSVTGANTDSGSDVTDANGEATFTYTGTSVGLDTINAYADTDGDSTQDPGEPFGTATKTWTPGAPTILTLSPKTDTNTVGTPHTVTATVTDAFGNPVPGVTVRFSASGANSDAGSDVTDANGEATFTYTGTTVGLDTISAYADSDNDSTQDPGEPFDTATKTWTPGAPANLTLSPKIDTNQVGTSHTVTATVEDAFSNAVPGVTVRFSVTGANTDSGSDVTDANGEATFTYTGTTAGTDSISAFADSNNDGDQDPGEPFDAASKIWTPAAPATLTLAPPADTNTVGTTHCVTATVFDAFGNPVPGVIVRFSVPTAVATFASPSSGSDVTDANGEATFCYSASLPGVDAIHAFADTNSDGDQDAGEPFGDATKTWTPPPSTEFCEVKVTEGGWIIANNGDRASFGGNAKVLSDGSVQGNENYQDHGPVQPRHVQSIELTAVTCTDDLRFASIFGRATIDGSGSFVFRIDVSDQGEPGRDDSYGIILSDGYASGQQQLQGGNVQIHKN